jgi:hypothetical protein
LATISARIASTCPSRPFGAPRARPGLRSAGGADRIQRVGLTLPAAVLPVGPVHLNDPDAGRADMPGQAGAVAAGALDPDQGDGPEPGQPLQQAGVAGRGDRELLDAEQPANRIQRGRDMRVGVGVYPASDGACLYDGQCHLSSLVAGMARTRWPSDL